MIQNPTQAATCRVTINRFTPNEACFWSCRSWRLAAGKKNCPVGRAVMRTHREIKNNISHLVLLIEYHVRPFLFQSLITHVPLPSPSSTTLLPPSRSHAQVCACHRKCNVSLLPTTLPLGAARDPSLGAASDPTGHGVSRLIVPPRVVAWVGVEHPWAKGLPYAILQGLVGTLFGGARHLR